MGVIAFIVSTIVAAVAILAIVANVYLGLRRLESANTPVDTLVDPDVMASLTEAENLKDTQQNHLAGISIMQAGALRGLALRIAFWVIGQMATKRFRPGFLGDISTIHYARWLRLPKTNKLLFFSNYGGSWESYLEDFITRASNGLTAVWSNTVGFPRTENLLGCDRRRSFQALGAQATAADVVLVQRLSASDDGAHPHQCSDPPGTWNGINGR
ncbi:hypothetical protein [Rhizobium altiplani]|uniref:hypothetical protein n=1 Tax=Rhizobium altiplani TaxID=1864509 RepID=UPI000AD1B174|nr:hypothetical protein [Rhizobium altiplani]